MTPTDFRKKTSLKYFVAPHKDGWAVRSSKGSPVAYSYKSQHDAILTARHLARNENAELAILDMDGSIKETISYKLKPSFY